MRLGPWESDKAEMRFGYFSGDLDEFVSGKILHVALVSKRHKNAELARLSPPNDEIWELRSQAPPPGLRLFGRFAERDCFIGLICLERKSLGGKSNNIWNWVSNSIKSKWQNLFPAYSPFSGDTVNDYLTNAYDIDDLK